MRIGVFLVTSPRQPNLNVIVSAIDHETATGIAKTALGGNPDQYTVTPITKMGKRTIFITITESVDKNS